MLTLSEKLAEKTNYLSPREIEGILHILLEQPGVSNNLLVQITGIPKETLKEFKVAASFLLQNTENDSINISQEYISTLRSESPKAFTWRLLNLENPDLTAKLTNIRKNVKNLPNRELDQFYATPETTTAKVLLLEKKGVLDNGKIAILGDDDLVSIGLALMPKSKVSLTVLEADRALLSIIESIAGEMGIKDIRTIAYDARKELPPDLKGQFNAVVTDPPYTKAGVTLFLNRAIGLLQVSGDKGGKYIFLYYGNSFKTPEKTLKIQEIINQMGLVIEDCINKFATYSGAESIGNNSAVYILKTTPFTHTLDQVSDYSQLYTYQQKKEEKFPYVDHVVCKIYNVSNSIINSKSALLKILGEFCQEHKLKVVDEKLTKFKNGGMTITYILSNSNLVVHTWPEFSAVHIDLITCAPIYNKKYIGETLSKLFNSKNIEILTVE